MVPLLVLVALVPLASCGKIDDMEDMMQMMHMQQQMMNAHHNMGYNNNQMGGNMNQGNWWGMQSQEDYEAYLKWCEEKKRMEAESEQQKNLMEMYRKREEERKARMEKARMEHEAEERHEMMKQQFDTWQRRLEETQEFDALAYKLSEMKHVYSFAVVAEFLKFCKCSDFTEDLEKFFMHDGVSMSNHEFNLDDLEGIISSNDPVAVAQALDNRPKVDQTKAFFGGLAVSMCEGAEAYVRQLVAWEKEYNFMERLM